MSEPYKCGACNYGEFFVDTWPPPNGDKKLAVLVICRGCDAFAEAPTVTEAFQEISRPPNGEKV
jgi:hypothetical protein